MPNFLSRLFGKKKQTAPQESAELRTLVRDSKRTSGRREPPKEIDWSRTEYVPLPPSPPTWEVDGREEFNREYNNPSFEPIFQAGFKKQHTKVAKLAAGLTSQELQGRVGEAVAKAYSKLVMQRIQSGQLAAAARQCVEMFERVPEHVKDVDRRRFNRILKEMDKSGRKHDYTPVDVARPSSLPLFTVSKNAPWTLSGERKLSDDERPDPAFVIVTIDATGVWWLDRTGVSVGEQGVNGVLRRTGRSGCVVGDKALCHDTYRVGTNPAGSGIAIMDSDGVLHVYDTNLNIVTEVNLNEDPRVVDHFRTIETNYWGEFKSQVRAVSIAPTGDRYLFTLADEVWCCTASGSTVWGVVMPLKEGWKRVVRRSQDTGMAQEVEDALRFFDLTLPINPAEIKPKYRKLAQAYHPDRNAGDPDATEKMKVLNRAFEILTGVDPSTLSFEDSDVTYFARSAPDYVVEVDGFRLEIAMTGITPQDWVYEASFTASDGGAYLATYSGKVIQVTKTGLPEVIYDIGTCPKEVVDVGRYTYFLTPTRLYVIEDKRNLAAFLDVFQHGRLLVTKYGFGLLTDKQLQWFTPAGEKVGELKTKDPIRAIYAAEDQTVIQTRQHQIEIQGLVI